jgi:sugar phosphate isomerase/epimerase
MGYDGVEPLAFPERPSQMKRLHEICESHQMAVPMIAGAWGRYGKNLGAFPEKDPTSNDESRRKDAIEYIRGACDIAVDFNSPYVQVALGSLDEQDLSARGIETASKNLYYVLKTSALYARDRGVALILEPQCRFEGYYGVNTTVELSLKLIETLGEENVKIMFDTFHANIEEKSLISAIFEAKEKLRHVHVADNNRLPPSFGSLDFQGILGQLKRVDYSGFLGVECMPMCPEAESMLRSCLSYLKGIDKTMKE